MWVRLLCLLVACFATTHSDQVEDPYHPPFGRASDVRNEFAQLMGRGEIVSLIERAELINRTLGTLHLDDKLPSLFGYYGVALYSAQRVAEAERALIKAVEVFPNETRSWLNLGEIRVQTFQLKGAIEALNEAFSRGELTALPRLLRTKGWMADWKDFDLYTADLEKLADQCMQDGPVRHCSLDVNSGFEYTDIPGEGFRLLQEISPASHSSIAPLTEYSRLTNTGKLKIGFVSADFGVHPVSSLIRGWLYALGEKAEVHCFSLSSPQSWWGTNISAGVAGYYELPASNLPQAAHFIGQKQLDVVVDLNGHTMHTGLHLLALRPAPVLVTFLGLPTTTGTAYIDYQLSDAIASPPEHQRHVTEAMALLQGVSYIANDHANMQGDVGLSRAPRSALQVASYAYPNYLASFLPSSLGKAPAQDREHARRVARATKYMHTVHPTDRLYSPQTDLVWGTLSNSQKLDPSIFHVWTNLLQRFRAAVMCIWEYSGSRDYMNSLWTAARAYGLTPQRLVLIQQSPWIDHMQTKVTATRCALAVLFLRTRSPPLP